MHLYKLLTIFLLFSSGILIGQAEVNLGNDNLYSKGTWHTGLSMGLNSVTTNNVDNILLNIVDNKNKGFKINLLGGYFVKDGLSVGMRYGYRTSERDLLYLNSGNEARLQTANKSHDIVLFLRNYLPISKNGPFYFYNETALGAGFGNRLLRHTKSENDVTKSFTESTQFRLGLKPGLVINITEGFAFELSINLLGLTSDYQKIKKNGVDEGSNTEFNFDFDISLLSMDFGLAYYFK